MVSLYTYIYGYLQCVEVQCMYAYDMCECCLSIDYISISSTVDSIGYEYWIGN